MVQFLRQSTAVEVPIGPFVDATTGVDVEDGLTISQADVRLKKNDGDWAQKTESTAAAHEENGYYRCLLDTTDTATLGRLRLAVNKSGALPVWADFMVVPANVWDSLFGADKLDVNVAEWLGTAAATPTVAGVPEVDLTHWRGTAVPAEHTAGYPVVTVKDGSGAGEIDTSGGRVAADVQTWLGGVPAGSTNNGYLQVVLRRWLTDDVAGTPDALSAGGKLPASTDEWLQTAVPTPNTAGVPIVDLRSYTRVGTAQAGGANNEIILDAGASAIDGYYAGQWVTIIAGTGAGQTGLIDTYTGSDKHAVVAPPAQWKTNPDGTSIFAIWGFGEDSTAELEAVYNNTAAILDDTGSSGVVVAAASKTGYALSSAGVQAIWDALTSALTQAGSIGKLIVDNLNATISSRASQTSLDTIDDFLDTEIAAIKTVTDQFTAAQAEPTAVPAANATPLEKIAWIAMLARNKVTQTSTTLAVRNNADDATVGTATVSNDGVTYTRNKLS